MIDASQKVGFRPLNRIVWAVYVFERFIQQAEYEQEAQQGESEKEAWTEPEQRKNKEREEKHRLGRNPTKRRRPSCLPTVKDITPSPGYPLAQLKVAFTVVVWPLNRPPRF